MNPIPINDEDFPPFLMFSTRGRTADENSDMLGLFERTQQMKVSGEILLPVYRQLNDQHSETNRVQLSHDGAGGWEIKLDGSACVIASKNTFSPIEQVIWQYCSSKADGEGEFLDDPDLTVKGLTVKPNCQVTIALGGPIEGDVLMGAGKALSRVYTPTGTYHRGRQVLEHSDPDTQTRFTLSVCQRTGQNWKVESGTGADNNIELNHNHDYQIHQVQVQLTVFSTAGQHRPCAPLTLGQGEMRKLVSLTGDT